MQNRTEVNLFIDSLAFLVADKSNGKEEIQNFIVLYPAVLEELETIQILNMRTPKGTKVVESAARSGSVSSLQFLIEELQTEIKADENTPNLVEIALNNAKVREYLLDENKKIWEKFADGTTDFLAHVMAGRIEPALAMLKYDPGLIYSMNVRCQNAIYWSHAVKQHPAIFKTLAEDYRVINAMDNQMLARHYAAMGYFKLQYQFPQKPLIAIEQFEWSIHYYKKSIFENEDKPEVLSLLLRELSLVLLYSARLYTHLAQNQNAELTKLYIEKSEAYCQEGIKILRSVREIKISDANFILNNLLREHAENSYILDNFYFAQGESIKTDALDALDFFKKAIIYGEEAVRTLGDLTLKTPKDIASLTKSCDKLAMSYAAAKTCHQSLAFIRCEYVQENNVVSEFHTAEIKRYQDLVTKTINRKDGELPSHIVAVKTQSHKLFGKHTNGTNGLHNGHSPKLNGINGLNGINFSRFQLVASSDVVPVFLTAAK